MAASTSAPRSGQRGNWRAPGRTPNLSSSTIPGTPAATQCEPRHSPPPSASNCRRRSRTPPFRHPHASAGGERARLRLSHLATALEIADEPDGLVTYDRRMSDAADNLGLTILAPA